MTTLAGGIFPGRGSAHLDGLGTTATDGAWALWNANPVKNDMTWGAAKAAWDLTAFTHQGEAFPIPKPSEAVQQAAQQKTEEDSGFFGIPTPVVLVAAAGGLWFLSQQKRANPGRRKQRRSRRY